MELSSIQQPNPYPKVLGPSVDKINIPTHRICRTHSVQVSHVTKALYAADHFTERFWGWRILDELEVKTCLVSDMSEARCLLPVEGGMERGKDPYKTHQNTQIDRMLVWEG